MNDRTTRRSKNRFQHSGRLARAGSAERRFQSSALLILGGLGLIALTGAFVVTLVQPASASLVWPAIAVPLATLIATVGRWLARDRK